MALANSTLPTVTAGQQCEPACDLNTRSVVRGDIGYASPNFAQSVSSVTTAAASLVAASATRLGCVICPVNGTIYIGTSASVTTANGHPITANQQFPIPTQAAIFAIAGATVSVSVITI